jgi:hypothetical protein
MSNIQTSIDAPMTKEPMMSGFWVIYHRAHYLFEQGNMSKQFVFDECCAFRDRLLIETGTLYVPDRADEKSPSVELSVLLAFANVRWLNAEVRKRS